MSDDDLIARARAVVEDRDAGASEIVRALLPVLQEALAAGPEATRAVARVVCRTQPSMAPLWNACAAAIADIGTPGRFARFQQEREHQERALVRVAADAVGELLDVAAPLEGAPSGTGDPVVVTWSYSGSVAAVLTRVAAMHRVTVVCAEGRPRLEGRRLAARLAGTGARVIVTTDAAATVGLDRAALVLVGADAVLADRWINKVGTRALATAASHVGRPVVVVATRDKAVAPLLEAKLELSAGDPAEVWPDPPAGVEVSSPTFEAIPSELATWFATDAGLLTASDLPAFTRRNEGQIKDLIEALKSSRRG